MDGYSDMWYTRNGQDWVQVSMTEGRGSSSYTTQEWAKTTVEDDEAFLGKWGHTMHKFHKEEDLDGSKTIDTTEVGPFLFSGSVPAEVTVAVTEPDSQSEIDSTRDLLNFIVSSWTEIKDNETDISSLVIIGGDMVENGALVKDIFVSMPGLNCEREGIKCTGRGSCAPGNYGCVCFTKQFIGEYCELENKNYRASASIIKLATGSLVAVFVASMMLL